MDDHLHRPVVPAVIAGVALTALLVVLVFYAILGYETHGAVCTFRAGLVDQQAASHEFLTLSKAQRIARYGSIGDVPDSAIQSDVAKRQHTIDSLGSLHC